MRAPLRGCRLHRHVLNAFFNYAAAASRAQSKEELRRRNKRRGGFQAEWPQANSRESKCTLNCSLQPTRPRAQSTEAEEAKQTHGRNPQRDFFAAANPRSSERGWDIKRRSLKRPPQGRIGLINFVTLTRARVSVFFNSIAPQLQPEKKSGAAAEKTETNRSSITQPVTNSFFRWLFCLCQFFLAGTLECIYARRIKRGETTAITRWGGQMFPSDLLMRGLRRTDNWELHPLDGKLILLCP